MQLPTSIGLSVLAFSLCYRVDNEMTNGSKTFLTYEYAKVCDRSEHQHQFTTFFLRCDFTSDQLSDKEGKFANVS